MPFISAPFASTRRGGFAPVAPERPWTTSSSTYGNFDQLASRSPFRPPALNLEVSPARRAPGSPTLTSEGVGSFYPAFKPMQRPRP